MLVPYFKAGLESHELCVWVISDLTEQEAWNALTQAVPDFDRYLADRSMEIIGEQEWYFNRGALDLDQVKSGWNGKLSQALDRGYAGMTVTGSAFWLKKKDGDDFNTYEEDLNRSIVNLPMTCLCSYPLAASGATEILDVARTHQFAVARRRGNWEVVETPELKQAKAETRRLNQELESALWDQWKSRWDRSAFELSRPQHQGRYEVTVYQVGWRIGGKGASGRNQQCADRIEEHGLHLWFGFYDNAFRMMRECYDELSRSRSKPLATLEDAFKPCNDFILYEKYKQRWIGHPFHAPPNGKKPGDIDTLPQFWEIAENALRWVLSLWTDLAPRKAAILRPSPANQVLSRNWRRLANEIRADLKAAVKVGAGSLLKLAHDLAKYRSARLASSSSRSKHYSVLGRLLTEFRDWLWGRVRPNLDDCELRFLFTTVDFITTVINGVIRDHLIKNGLGWVNDEDFLKWLERHGAKPITRKNSVFVRMPYSAAFAFLDGNVNQPNLAAGVALSTILWVLFCYKGALLYKMQAGMGDVVFAPLYEVLKARGSTSGFFMPLRSCTSAEA
jgi:uncharacterized protein with NAD-binding domain and iron-sulfur cluster